MSRASIILASQSPRRMFLLQQIGIKPLCKPVHIDESILDGESSLIYCNRLALEKAQAGWNQSNKTLPVLGADTIVVLADKILGKPKDEDDAINMLRVLANKQHQVITAVAMVDGSKAIALTSISQVTFSEISDEELLEYVTTKEPMDKAGSYGIQGYAARWIIHISGSYSGIMGLPLYETTELIRKFV